MEESDKAYEREHVTPYLYQQPMFIKKELKADGDYSQYRWTVDTKEDYELVRLLLEELYLIQPYFSWRDVLSVLERHPEWKLINAEIEQKKLEE